MISVTNQSLKGVSGIYAITNTLNGKVYVGAAKSIGNRFSGHRSSLAKKKHHSILLQRAWDKYGEDAFVFEVLEVLDNYYQEAPEREIYWIEFLKSANPQYGYNIIAAARLSEIVASLNASRTWTDEARARMSEAQKGKKQTGRAAVGEEHFNGIQYSFLSPDQKTIYQGKNVAEFARSQGLCARGFINLANGKAISHLGWTNYENPRHRGFYFRLRSPDGIIHEGYNLSKFCKEHGLGKSGVYRLVKGEIGSHKGWICPDLTFEPNTTRWKRFKITNPHGVVLEVHNLRRFAREHGLDAAALYRVLKGEKKSHKSWTKA